MQNHVSLTQTSRTAMTSTLFQIAFLYCLCIITDQLNFCAKKEMDNKGERMEINKEETNGNVSKIHDVPLMALNHASRLCRSVKDSMDFYTKVLGFVLIERPQAFDFDGAWLFNYGVGIHLVQAKDEDRLPDHRDHLDPMDNHISFQCEDMEAMEQYLKEFNVKYIKRTVGDGGGEAIDQLFFNDPDGFMIEICNCENMKLVPQRSIGRIKLPSDRHKPLQLDLDDFSATNMLLQHDKN